MIVPSAWWRGPLVVLLIGWARLFAALADLAGAISKAGYDAALAHLQVLKRR